MKSVSAYRTKVEIPTYEVLEPDLNPILDKALSPYPYPMQNDRSGAKAAKSYEAVVLENEYLQLTVIPSLGGRLISMVDKRKNREALYRNGVIKPRMIGTRGAWFSGGIEFNFPISHSPHTMDRINCTVCTNEDGSASVIFGNIEQISFMNWKVELRLYPGKAFVEQNVRLANSTARENRFYFWTNAAVNFGDHLELIYPFDWCVNNWNHRYGRWPHYKEIDCRRAERIPFAFETFGKLMTDNFFGIYDHDADCGLVHYADRKRLKGAKFFTWGTDQFADAWNRALTDDGSRYIEIQSGPFETQMVYKFLKPHQTLGWSEYWFPVHETKGLQYAEKELAVGMERIDGGIRLALLATETLTDCRIVLSSEGLNDTVIRSLTPDRVEKVVFELAKPVEPENVKLDIYCANRRIISMGYREETDDEYPDENIFEDSRVVTAGSAQHSLLKQAQFKESLGALEEALALFEENLEYYPQCVITLNRLANLYLKSRRWHKAEENLLRVLAYDNRNSHARFHLASLYKEQGRAKRARRLFMDIAADAEYYGASVVELIKLDIALGYFQEALSLIEGSGLDDSYIRFLAGIAKRKNGLTDESENLADSMTEADECVLAERYIAHRTDEDRAKFLAFTEGDERVLVPVILQYVEMRLYDDAEALIRLIGRPTMKSRLISVFIREQTSGFEEKILHDVLAMPPDYFFVNEPVLIGILLQYQAKDPSGVIDYLLGTWLYTVSRKEEALEHLLSAYGKGMRYTVLLHNLGYLYFFFKKDLTSAARYWEEDLQHHGAANEAVIQHLDALYCEQGSLDRRVQLLPYMLQAKNRSLVLIPLVNLYLDTGEEEKALHVLENNEFENWEGKESSGPAYRETIIRLAMKALNGGDSEEAMEWIGRVTDYPANLNFGDSVTTALADVYYHQGFIYAAAGKEEEAGSYFRRGRDELEDDRINLTAKSKRYSALCAEEMEKL